MGDLSENFSRKEFECKCGCDFNTVDAELIKILQNDLRDYYKKKVVITYNGGCRCYIHNIVCEGSSKSQHIKGKAADIKVEGVSSKAVYTYLCRKFPDKYGFGLYKTFVHVDVREDKARWSK